MKILVTSIGSLVGQNILECLSTRRARIQLIGANSGAQHPRVFQCDRLYKVPESSDRQAYFAALMRILEKEEPDVVLAGRDQDTVELSYFRRQYPKYATLIPAGEPEPAEIMQDKLRSYTFATEQGLPFAQTLDLRTATGSTLADFIDRTGFPLIAKLQHGFGSSGVYIVSSLDDIARLRFTGSFILQEYLDPDPDIEKYIRKYRISLPLFFQIPENRQYASQLVIGKNGVLSDIFVSINRMVLGRCEYSEKFTSNELLRLTEKTAQAFYRSGWIGSLNIQWKPDSAGNWKIIEFNPRMTGSTSARFRMGFDEIGILCDFFVPGNTLPNLSDPHTRPCCVHRTLADMPAYYDDIDKFNAAGYWEKS